MLIKYFFSAPQFTESLQFNEFRYVIFFKIEDNVNHFYYLLKYSCHKILHWFQM